MANKAKLEMVSASEVQVGEVVHFTAAGLGFTVREKSDGVIFATRVDDAKHVTVPFTRFTLVVVER